MLTIRKLKAITLIYLQLQYTLIVAVNPKAEYNAYGNKYDSYDDNVYNIGKLQPTKETISNGNNQQPPLVKEVVPSKQEGNPKSPESFLDPFNRTPGTKPPSDLLPIDFTSETNPFKPGNAKMMSGEFNWPMPIEGVNDIGNGVKAPISPINNNPAGSDFKDPFGRTGDSKPPVNVLSPDFSPQGNPFNPSNPMFNSHQSTDLKAPNTNQPKDTVKDTQPIDFDNLPFLSLEELDMMSNPLPKSHESNDPKASNMNQPKDTTKDTKPTDFTNLPFLSPEELAMMKNPFLNNHESTDPKAPNTNQPKEAVKDTQPTDFANLPFLSPEELALMKNPFNPSPNEGKEGSDNGDFNPVNNPDFSKGEIDPTTLPWFQPNPSTSTNPVPIKNPLDQEQSQLPTSANPNNPTNFPIFNPGSVQTPVIPTDPFIIPNPFLSWLPFRYMAYGPTSAVNSMLLSGPLLNSFFSYLLGSPSYYGRCRGLNRCQELNLVSGHPDPEALAAYLGMLNGIRFGMSAMTQIKITQKSTIVTRSAGYAPQYYQPQQLQGQYVIDKGVVPASLDLVMTALGPNGVLGVVESVIGSPTKPGLVTSILGPNGVVGILESIFGGGGHKGLLGTFTGGPGILGIFGSIFGGFGFKGLLPTIFGKNGVQGILGSIFGGEGKPGLVPSILGNNGVNGILDAVFFGTTVGASLGESSLGAAYNPYQAVQQFTEVDTEYKVETPPINFVVIKAANPNTIQLDKQDTNILVYFPPLNVDNQYDVTQYILICPEKGITVDTRNGFSIKLDPNYSFQLNATVYKNARIF